MLRLEVGLVSADRGLVDFLATVFELEELAPEEHAAGTLHRLASPGAVLKVMVPAEAPGAADRPASFIARVGLRYLTVWVTDLDAVITRAVASGGRILHGPFDLSVDVRMVILEDPDGNAIEVLQERS